MAARSRAAARRSPRPARRAVDAAPPERPLVVPFAAFFGLLVAAEDAYLAWLLWTPQLGWDWFMAVPLLLAVLALAGAALVLTGRARGWLVLAVAAALSLVGLVVLAAFFAVLGGTREVWSTLLLLVGPLTCFGLALRAPVRAWTRAPRSTGAGPGRPGAR